MNDKKLGIVRNIVESVGMEVTHVYEDLVFLNHNAFLLRFADSDNSVLMHGNNEADPASLADTLAIVRDAAVRHEMTFLNGVPYRLSQGENEELRIEFMAESGHAMA